MYDRNGSSDPLDTIESSNATLVGSPPPSKDVLEIVDRRVLRPRLAQLTATTKHDYNTRRGSMSIVIKIPAPASSMARKRTQSEAGLDENSKRNKKKALTIVLNVKRANMEMSRKRWLHAHRALFEPLLPPSSVFFEHVIRELEHHPVSQLAYIPRDKLTHQPKSIQGGTMKDYQLEGLGYLSYMFKNGINCILGDEMGLGKTLQTLSLFADIRDGSSGSEDPHLIICPLSVLSSWENECKRWLPSFRVIRFHGAVSERQRLKQQLSGSGDGAKFDLCLATYESYAAEDGWFKTRRWTCCVLDEGHKIKNWETRVAKLLSGLGSLYRLILTGTPIQNNLMELWSLLHWLYPSIFTAASERLFKESFDLTKGTYDTSFMRSAGQLLNVVMLRRTKASLAARKKGSSAASSTSGADVPFTPDDIVPPREETTVFVPMTEAQRFWTYRLLTRMDSASLGLIFGSGEPAKAEEEAEIVKKEEKEEENTELDFALTSAGNLDDGQKEVMQHLQTHMKQAASGSQYNRLMNLLMQLRLACDHPYLLRDAEPNPYHIGEHVVAASAKLIAIDKILKACMEKGERVLIFSQFVRMLDLLEDHMALRGIAYARLDGGSSRPRRTLDIKLFQRDVSPYKVFLISTKAGGLGINLTKATTVIMVDSDWNPQNDLQAIARAHRIGQTKVVQVYRLICRGSVEDQMLDRIRRKLFLSLKILNSNSTDQSSNPSSAETLDSSALMDILRKGSSARSGIENGMDLQTFIGASLEEILAASKVRESGRVAKIEKESGGDSATLDDVKDVNGKTAEKVAEEEEKRLLAGVAQVRSRFFEGKLVQKQMDNRAIAKEWDEVQKMVRKGERSVVIDGMRFARLDEREDAGGEMPVVIMAKKGKVEKVKHGHENWCIYCRDGGDMICCGYCPRVFHPECQGQGAGSFARSIGVKCGQHDCWTCGKGTSQAGGMLFRCQTCPNAFCEDCLSDDVDYVGDVLPEFELLDYPEKSSSYFIRCDECKVLFLDQPEIWDEWQVEMKDTQRQLRKKLARQAFEALSP